MTPDHYKLGQSIDTLDLMRGCMTREQYIGFLRGNVIKYAVRLGRKGDAETVKSDAQKLADYANRLASLILEKPGTGGRQC